MVKFLIGGSPCTHWSIAQRKARETAPEGEGWELFKNYLIAKEKFRPDFFLYENNKSAAQQIKDRIKKELNVNDGTLFGSGDGRYIEINSALVSAQNRQRFYVHSCGDVFQPEDRGILLQDILEDTETGETIADREKSDCFRATYDKCGRRNFEENIIRAKGYQGVPVRVGCLPNARGEVKENQSKRIYSAAGKARTLNACGLSGGSSDLSAPHTGLYAYPAINGKSHYPIYLVKNNQIEIKGTFYKMDLPDGYYIIRKLTVTECCRLQTLPDNYCRAVSETQAYRGLGNGWTAEVIIHILSHALAEIPKDEEIVVLSMYDGIGTGRYCFDKMGYKNIRYFAYEIEKPAMQIAESNFPDIVQCGDAFSVRESGWGLPI